MAPIKVVDFKPKFLVFLCETASLLVPLKHFTLLSGQSVNAKPAMFIVFNVALYTIKMTFLYHMIFLHLVNISDKGQSFPSKSTLTIS